MKKPKKRQIKRAWKEARKKGHDRAFHPVIEMLAHAERELAVLVVFARELGIRFDDWSHANGHFRTTVSRDRRDLRGITLFAEIERAEGFDVRYGMRLSFYDGSVHNRFVLDVLLWARVSAPGLWTLEREAREDSHRASLDITHAVRRIGAVTGDPRPCSEEEMIKRAFKMLREYREVVLIPRAANGAADHPSA